MRVKICGLTNAADAAFAAAEGADYLGFVVHPPSPRHCADLAGAASPARDRAVLVTVAEDAEAILRIAGAAGIRNIQPHVSKDHRQSVVQRLKSEGYFIILPWIDVSDQAAISADLYLWEPDPRETGVAGGSGRTHAMAFPPPGPFLLAGGLGADNVRQRAALCPADARKQLRGFDAASRLEFSPGVKDPMKVRAFIQTAKSMSDEAPHARD
jgi:phosphoribosylanthranilate isomerase